MHNRLTSLANSATPLLIILAVFCINLPIAFGSVSLVLLLICWLFSGDYQSKFKLIKANPGALIALGLLALYGLGVLYSSAPLGEAFHYFLKYSKLLLIPMLVSVLTSEQHRKYAINAFLISLIGYLAVSYLNWFGFFSLGFMHHGTYMAIGLYLMLGNARRFTGQYRLAWITLAVLTAFNILVIADVRTGVITLFSLLALFSYETWGKKTLFYCLGLLILAFALIQTVPSFKHLNPRLTHLHQEVTSHRANDPAHQTSAGQRLDMYRNTLKLIQNHLILGGGTGSLKGEYAELIKGSDVVVVRVTNPHNQYLSTTQDLGLAGLAVLLAFFLIHWRQAYQLSSEEYGSAFRGLILAMVLGSLVNSLLLDGGDGRMYCLLAGVFLSRYHAVKRE